MTLEHALLQWLAKEIELSGVSLRHFRRDDSKQEDILLRSHPLKTFGSKTICCICNNGWMSRLEVKARRPLILGLMNQKTNLLSLSDDSRLVLSRWAVKTAFMIATVQTMKFDLPWSVFQRLGELEDEGPHRCFVLGSQQPSLPKGFLYTCPSDGFATGKPI